jgi:Tfp pilus assembly protein PilF
MGSSQGISPRVVESCICHETGAEPGKNSVEMARQLANEGRSQLAVEILGDLLEQDPVNVEAFTTLAYIWEHMGKTDQCIHCFKKALYLDPLHVSARLHLADAYRSMGKTSLARREYKNVISLLENSTADLPGCGMEGFSRDLILETARTRLNACAVDTDK